MKWGWYWESWVVAVAKGETFIPKVCSTRMFYDDVCKSAMSNTEARDQVQLWNGTDQCEAEWVTFHLILIFNINSHMYLLYYTAQKIPTLKPFILLVCVCMRSCMYVYMCTCVWRMQVHVKYLRPSFSILVFWDRVSGWALSSPIWLIWLVRGLHVSSLPSTSPGRGLQRGIILPRLLKWVLGIKFRSESFHGRLWADRAIPATLPPSCSFSGLLLISLCSSILQLLKVFIIWIISSCNLILSD